MLMKKFFNWIKTENDLLIGREIRIGQCVSKNKRGDDTDAPVMACKPVKIQHAFSIARAHSDSLAGRSVSQPHFLRLFAQVSSVLEYYELAFALAKKQVPVVVVYTGMRSRM